MSTPLDFDNCYELAVYFEHSLAAALYDLEQWKDGKPPVYNIDFSLLCTHLFERNAKGSKAFLPLRDMVARIFDGTGGRERLKLVISGPTYLEFLDHLEHTRYELQADLPAFLDNRLADIRNLDSSPKSSALLHKLSIFSDRGYSTLITAPIQRLKSLLQSSIVQGIGDFVKSPDTDELVQLKDRFQAIVEQERRSRIQRDRETREDEDSMFHYKMDALNICLSFLYRAERELALLFVTPTSTNIRQSDLQGERFGRLPAVPLMIKNAFWLETARHIPNMRRYLTEGMRRISEILGELDHNKVRLNPNPYVMGRFYDFMRTYGYPLHSCDKENSNPLGQCEVEQIRRLLGDKDNVKDILQRAVADLRSGAEELQKYAPRFHLHSFDVLGIGNDPVVKRIKANLGVPN